MSNEKIAIPGCLGTTVQKLFSKDGTQVLRVEVEPGGEIPMHMHECAATMVIIKGSALALGCSPRLVSTGDVVVKTPNELHGFAEIKEPFGFISVSDNQGIMQNDQWDIAFP